jgi:4-hydroxybenzoate polyprenyltransferase
MERTLSIRSLVRISRPINLLLIAFAQAMVAYFLIGTDRSGLPVLQDYRLYLLVLATLLITAAGYMINDYYDVKIDLINRPKAVVVGKASNEELSYCSIACSTLPPSGWVGSLLPASPHLSFLLDYSFGGIATDSSGSLLLEILQSLC